mmetsp:Transcript_25955/g.87598  ORF Transcript_25955/g.87598 Transcript_25955/m.87598 type:complete len:282 (-) Transcript_25955:340-1185(-)
MPHKGKSDEKRRQSLMPQSHAHGRCAERVVPRHAPTAVSLEVSSATRKGAPGGQYWSRSGGPLPARARGRLPAPSPISLALAASGAASSHPSLRTEGRAEAGGLPATSFARRGAARPARAGQGRGRRAREKAAPPFSPPRTGPTGRRGSESGPCPPTRSCRDAAATRGAGRGRGRGHGRAGCRAAGRAPCSAPRAVRPPPPSEPSLAPLPPPRPPSSTPSRPPCAPPPPPPSPRPAASQPQPAAAPPARHPTAAAHQAAPPTARRQSRPSWRRESRQASRG